MMGASEARQGAGWRGFLLLVLLTFGVVGFWCLDHLTNPEATTGVEAGEAGGRRAVTARARVFFLLVDSLRLQTATDPEQMPRTSALLKTGTWGPITSSRDAVTVSAIRAMFTGRERFALFGFVENFAKGKRQLESIFGQLSADRKFAEVYSDGSFTQFSEDIPQRNLYSGDLPMEGQHEMVRDAMASFLAGEQDLMVVHINHSDQVAHKRGIHDPEYAEAYTAVDGLIAEVAATLPPSVTLVIAGDHGHTEDGRHALGLEVPTLALYRGDAFVSGVELPRLPITAHRYFMSWALAQPLSTTYQGPRYPEALRDGDGDGGARPEAYAASVPFVESGVGLKAPPESKRVGFFVLALTLGMIGGLWCGLAWRGLGGKPAAAAIVLGLLSLLGLPSSIAWPFASWLPLLLMLMRVVQAAGVVQSRRVLVWSQNIAGIGILCMLWGFGLAAAREWLHEFGMWWVYRITGVVLALVAWRAHRSGETSATRWWVLAPLLVLYPTIYRYGAMAWLFMLWLMWLTATAVAARAKGDAWAPRQWWVFVAIGFLLQGWVFPESNNFQLSGWYSWIDALAPRSLWSLASLSVACRLVWWVRLDESRAWRAASAVVALGTATVWWGLWAPSRWLLAALVLGLSLLAWRAPRLLGDRGEAARRICGLAAWTLVTHHLVRASQEQLAWMDITLTALFLSAWVAKRALPEAEHEGAHAQLLVIAFCVAGWVTMGWTLHGLEWGFTYDWFEALVVEQNVQYFAPVIALKYLLPLLMARYLLRQGLGEHPRARRVAVLLVGIKLMSTVLVCAGLGFWLADTGVYLEGAQECAIMMILCLGLL